MPPTSHPARSYVDHVHANGDCVAQVAEAGPLDAPVPSCPGWTLRDLVEHLGFIHRWARLAAATGAPPDNAQIDAAPGATGDGPADRLALATWMRHGVEALTDTLGTLDLEAATWHPFLVAKVGAVWPRRQAHETSIHRWDAESAIGASLPLDRDLSADGIDEYFGLVVPRVVQRDGRSVPVGTLLVSCTDVDRHLLVTSADGSVVGSAPAMAGTVADVVVSGDAESLLLALWGRRPLADPPTDPIAGQWFGIGGN